MPKEISLQPAFFIFGQYFFGNCINSRLTTPRNVNLSTNNFVADTNYPLPIKSRIVIVKRSPSLPNSFRNHSSSSTTFFTGLLPSNFTRTFETPHAKRTLKRASSAGHNCEKIFSVNLVLFNRDILIRGAWQGIKVFYKQSLGF